MRLPNDVCRCDGTFCPIKETCLRHTYEAPPDDPRSLWGYPRTDMLCDPQEKIKPYWISNEQKEP
jgi:hypothetical protein